MDLPMAACASKAEKSTPSRAMREWMLDGAPAQDLEWVFPSPHPEYLHAMLLMPANLYGLFHSEAAEKDFDEHSNAKVRYLLQWQISHLAQDSMEDEVAAGTRVFDGNWSEDLKARIELLRRIQKSVVQNYTQLKELVWNWLSQDAQEKAARQYDARPVIQIDSETMRESGGMVMRSHWRKELGWRGSESIQLAARARRHQICHEKTALAHDDDFSNTVKAVTRKFVWDFERGKWTYAANDPVAKKQKHTARMLILGPKIARIKASRDNALRELGLEHVLLGRQDRILYHQGVISKVDQGDELKNSSHQQVIASSLPNGNRLARTPSLTFAHAQTVQQSDAISGTGIKRKPSADATDKIQRRRRARVPARQPRVMRSLHPSKT